MHLNILPQTRHQKPSGKELRLIARLVDLELGTLPGVVNLIFCDDPTIRQLNKEHRKKDKLTDVLTFTYFQLPTSPKDLLGEIFLDLQQVERQAKEHQHAVEMELYTLCIHGLLHLRGYDHEGDEEYRVMKLLEDKIMKCFLKSAQIRAQNLSL